MTEFLRGAVAATLQSLRTPTVQLIGALYISTGSVVYSKWTTAQI